jgi:hypothetical protein
MALPSIRAVLVGYPAPFWVIQIKYFLCHFLPGQAMIRETTAPKPAS